MHYENASTIICTLGGRIVLFAAFIAIYRPYEHNFHNFSLLFNQFSLATALFWHTYLHFYGQNDTIQLYCIYVQFSCLSLVLFCASIRTVIEFRMKLKDMVIFEGRDEANNEKTALNQSILKKDAAETNIYRLKSQNRRDNHQFDSVIQYSR